MATHVRKEFGNKNAVSGPKPILKKTNNKTGPESSKIVAKVFREPNVTARGPLGELGNKPLSLKPSNTAELIPKIVSTTNGTLKNNLPVIRNKNNTSKENVIKPVQANKPQHRVPINPTVLKRQESILSKLVKPLSNINVKEDKDKVKTVLPATTSYSSKQLVDIIDVDQSTEDDPHFVSTYVKDIMRYLLDLEKRYAITENYLLNSNGSNHNTSPKMRSVLVNWLVEVHSSFSFLPETLHLSVAITDRYLQKMPDVGRKTLQLVGTIALYVAGKYEEIYIPEISEFVFMCDDIFSKTQMFQMERDILTRMNFELGGPLSLHFLRRYNKIAKVDIEHHALGKYLIELALVDHRVSHVSPSLQAAAACFLALATLGTSNNSKSSTRSYTNSPPVNVSQYWTKTLTYYSTYSFETIVPHMHNLACLLIEAPNSKYQAVRTKYSRSDHKKISLHVALQSPIVKKFANFAHI